MESLQGVTRQAGRVQDVEGTPGHQRPGPVALLFMMKTGGKHPGLSPGRKCSPPSGKKAEPLDFP